MEQTSEPKPRLNLFGRAARTKRIFARLRDGWAYDEIARDERLTAERVRQIVAEVLGKRAIDRGQDHAHLQRERLAPALRESARKRSSGGSSKAVAPLIKVIDRLDRHQAVFTANYDYGDEERERLLAKLNRAARNLGLFKEAEAAVARGETGSGRRRGGENIAGPSCAVTH